MLRQERTKSGIPDSSQQHAAGVEVQRRCISVPAGNVLPASADNGRARGIRH